MSAPAAATAAASETRPHRPNRNRQRRPNQTPQNPERTVGGRRFGGQLTRLQPDAAVFVPASVPPLPQPGPQGHQRSTPKLQPSSKPLSLGSHRERRISSASRSTAPDITTRTHEDISRGIYECAICTNEIARNSKIWSCRTCWTVFHLSCIKTWSKNEGAAVHRPNNAGGEVEPLPKQWRCPGCNLPKESLPSAYTCWCEKEISPKMITGLPPHSCGQTCGRSRSFPKACPHPCDIVCHAGPCPPCTSMGPQQVCFCGKEATARKCADTNYESGWSCGETCGDIMPCGEHTCPRSCHEGLCGACEVDYKASCYCGKTARDIQCHQKGEEKKSYNWVGTFECHQTCDNLMDCGIHRCQKSCHPQDGAIPHCPQSPDVVSHCPCGKTSLRALLEAPRKNCTDPIPHCDQPCGKVLACGHSCKQVCHLGECRGCMLTVSLTCRCGRNSFKTICHQGSEEPPHCLRVCKATLNCGRHECGERCCTGERKAIERQATKRKLKPLGVGAALIDEGIEAEHICTKVCGRSLKCGNHSCPDLCHRGPCASCKEAVFEDLSCNCGRTILQAPLPCGTKQPLCNFPCQRPKVCGHPQVAHNCHTEDDNCPHCPFLTEKPCLCGKKTLKNQPCWRTDVLCGLVCGKLLKCGSHTCQKPCHRAGDCEDAYTSCTHECSKPKKTCGHPCERVCHAPSVCKEDKPCPFKVIITCDCQRKKEEVKCNARASITDPPGRQTSLKCDDECARLERNRKLALALHISDDHTDDHVPYSTATLNMYLADVPWAHKQEELLRLFAADQHEKRLRFPPMKNQQRAFIHSLTEDFGFDCESVDPEPHRHVLIFKTPKFVAAPMKTLAQAARVKRAALNVSAPVASASEKRADEVHRDYNGFLLSRPRFALTEDELRPVLAKASPHTEFDIIFLPVNDTLALIPSHSWETAEQLTAMLKTLQPGLAAEIIKHGFAASVLLCQYDMSGSQPSILHQQGRYDKVATDGWSQVAAKRSAPVQAPRVEPVGQRPVYTVLGSRLAEAKKKRKDSEEQRRQKAAAEAVVEDWEEEADKQDEVGGEESSKAVADRPTSDEDNLPR